MESVLKDKMMAVLLAHELYSQLIQHNFLSKYLTSTQLSVFKELVS